MKELLTDFVSSVCVLIKSFFYLLDLICFVLLCPVYSHTTPGSLKTCVYEGVKYTSFSDERVTDINELLNADIVLTTYDVLKEDLPHDSERHEGDQRSMRYEKRYSILNILDDRLFLIWKFIEETTCMNRF